VARQWRQDRPTAWALVVHDWSALSYPKHTGKRDGMSHGSKDSRGYDLGTLLLVDGESGDPVAPLEMELRAADEIHSTRVAAVRREDSRLDNILPAMPPLDAVVGRERVVHIIDREADSVVHYRDWQANHRCFLVRGKADRHVRWNDQTVTLADIQRQLQAQRRFQRLEPVRYRGQTAQQHVCETQVILDRPGWQGGRSRNPPRSNHRVRGPAITLRLIISRVCDGNGQTLATWFLLSNTPAAIPAATLAQWYYWRWRIESFFKLLKSAGQAVEQWQQETGAAIAKRLLVAAMACTLVWKLERVSDPEAIRFRTFLVRLSGRQMKYGKSFTAPAILAGLWVYLAMLEALEQHTVADLQAMKQYLRLVNCDSG